ncbi:hypothetical protein Nocox_14765 [Nonomuraea coxensis DSM 45129]|uniref:Uncharacterized protein n=1 Tax=Nonomuraea coxensis DSM 45129 TaxID=1122611 RepID=A0ABX8TZ65_9ACTN|nr:hypothetical protein [Nonomuraea coxensis]QYC40568.1 hypothetical protein Nocox_14765 [Nonomuraea coxensis DSM 45129]
MSRTHRSVRSPATVRPTGTASGSRVTRAAESGHLTPRLKVKRDLVLRDFSGQIEELYGGGN